ncbi:Hint domain-containing protein [Acetobacter indonesiensis]|uniref:Hint domain-containing protein n=1 Tax=Acetobacter indonesiensis TaxID=104101 RepID=UPI000A37A2DE|nr:Hint domain-containing protein [Acetobacter indonesiensis]
MASNYVISSGQHVSNVTLSDGDRLFIESGASAERTIFGTGSIEVVLVGGSASSELFGVSGGVIASGIQSNALLTSTNEIDANGRAGVATNNTVVGGIIVAVSGGTTLSNTITQSGRSLVLSGSLASGNDLTLGGLEVVSAGGFAKNEIVSDGGELDAYGSETILSQILVNGGFVYLENGVHATSNTVVGDGNVSVTNGSVVSATTVSHGGQMQALSGGTLLSNTVATTAIIGAAEGGILSGNTAGPGGQLQVSSGGFASGNFISGNLSVEVVSSGGTAVGATVVSAGQLQVSAGGYSENDTIIGSNTLEFAYSGGTVAHETLLSGAQLQVFSNAKASGDVLRDSGTFEVVYSGGVAVGETVYAGAELDARGSGALVSGATASGGVLWAGSGGVLSGNILYSGASLQIESGSFSYGNTLNSGSYENLTGSSIARGETVLDGANVKALDAGSRIEGATVSKGGILAAKNGGVADGNSLSGGQLEIGPGGLASNNIFVGSDVDYSSSQQGEWVQSGGTVSHETFLSSAALRVDAGGSASDIQINGAEINLVSGGTVDTAHLSSDSLIIVGQNAVLKNTEIASGTELIIQSPASFLNDTIDIGAKVGVGVDAGVTTMFSGNKLIIQGNNGSQTLTINGNGDEFFLQPVAGEDGIFTLEEGTPCYCRGTLIATARGDIPVEALRIGDQVATASNGYRPVRWIGRRSYSGQFANGNRDVLPVVFRRGSLGNGLPRQDLSVSPLHAMYLDGVLIPAVLLVNGTSIVQAEKMDEVSYFHIELESHDIVFANGAYSETFVDDDSRGMFHNADEYAALYPNAVKQPAVYCAPRVEEGAQLENIRKTLAGLYAAAPIKDAPLEGFLDTVTRSRLSGWARNPKDSAPVCLQILDCGRVIGEVVANKPRPDVGTECGFVFDVPAGLSPLERHVLEVRRVEDHTSVGNVPWMLDQLPQAPVQAVVVSGAGKPLDGCLDEVTRDRVAGWAWNPKTPDEPVALQILDNGQLIASVLANGLRPDVKATGRNVRCGFDILLPGGLSPFTRHVIEVRGESDGTLLAAPTVIEPVTVFDDTFEQAVSRAVAAATDQKGQEHILSFLMGQVEKLSQAHAQKESGKADRELAASRRRRGLKVETSKVTKRVLVVDALRPRTDHDAGSCAIVSHMKAFQKLGYDVSFVAADQMADTGRGPVLSGVTVMAAPFYVSLEDLLRKQADSFDVVYLHRQDIASRYIALVRRYQRRARVVYSVADLHFVRLARQAQVLSEPALLAKAQSVQQAECAAARQADAVITHSMDEATLLRRDVASVNVHVVPWAVEPRKRVPGFAKRHGVVFVGNYTHTPNVDAARWLVEEIMPLVWAQDSSIGCTLVGAGMTEEVASLARKGVTVRGHVADLTSVFDAARLSVAPLRFGAGIKGKVLDSFAAALPCVMTGVAAEGLGLNNDLSQLVGRNAQELADSIVRIHNNAENQKHLARAAWTYVREHNAPKVVESALQSALEQKMKVYQVQKRAG